MSRFENKEINHYGHNVDTKCTMKKHCEHCANHSEHCGKD